MLKIGAHNEAAGCAGAGLAKTPLRSEFVAVYSGVGIGDNFERGRHGVGWVVGAYLPSSDGENVAIVRYA